MVSQFGLLLCRWEINNILSYKISNLSKSHRKTVLIYELGSQQKVYSIRLIYHTTMFSFYQPSSYRFVYPLNKGRVSFWFNITPLHFVLLNSVNCLCYKRPVVTCYQHLWLSDFISYMQISIKWSNLVINLCPIKIPILT